MNDSLNQWATWREIHSQPDIWAGWARHLDIAGLRAWIADQRFDDIWFCGAGTSAYIGGHYFCPPAEHSIGSKH